MFLDKDGTFWIGDIKRGRLQKYDPNGIHLGEYDLDLVFQEDSIEDPDAEMAAKPTHGGMPCVDVYPDGRRNYNDTPLRCRLLANHLKAIKHEKQVGIWQKKKADEERKTRPEKNVNQMGTEVERGQAPNTVESVHQADVNRPGAQAHVHFTDGTSLNVDGTIHDKRGGIPAPDKKTQKWLSHWGWPTEVKS